MKITLSKMLSIVLISTSIIYAYETLIANFDSLIFMYNGTNLNALTDYLAASLALFAAGVMMLITESVRAPLRRKAR